MDACTMHQYNLTKGKIVTSPTVTEVNMDMFQDEEGIVDADLKILKGKYLKWYVLMKKTCQFGK